MKNILLNIAYKTLEALSPEKLFKNSLPQKSLQGFEKILIIGIGKAAKGMVKGITPYLGSAPYKVLLADQGHPLPTQQGLKKTQKNITSAKELGEKDLAIVLLSGGGSAMLTAPVLGVSLNDKISLTKNLLRSGATIQEMNVIRKHLSQVKGGNLAALLYPATVWGFVISDVVGNDLSTIASGPLSPDPSTFKNALSILKKYRIQPPISIKKHLEAGLKNPLLETPKAHDRYFKKVTLKILADHQTAAQTASNIAKKMNLSVRTLKHPITGEARKVAKKLILQSTKGTLLIASGETTVTCRGNGQGGRNQELVLSALQYLKPNQIVLAMGTDGVDGICPQKIAGAIADKETLQKAKKQHLSIKKFLDNNDSYHFFKKTGGHIKTGPTGTNLGDLVLLLTT